tara:strand:- start:153 stop:635 length:483 start_codon:yes stop_codon:yes gene_type:complete
MEDSQNLNILLDSLTEPQKNERESKSQVTLEEMLKLVWTYERQNIVQKHLGMSTKHSTITDFIEKASGWRVKEQLNKGAQLKKKLEEVSRKLQIENRIADTYQKDPSPAVCTEKVIERIYEQQNTQSMISINVLKDHSLVKEYAWPMVEVMAVRAKEISN